MSEETGKLRIDKWLWAARFFKTRSLAADAVEGGKVTMNEARLKPAKAVGVGDRLEIRAGQFRFDVEVLALSGKRGPAPEAQKLSARPKTAAPNAKRLPRISRRCRNRHSKAGRPSATVARSSASNRGAGRAGRGEISSLIEYCLSAIQIAGRMNA